MNIILILSVVCGCLNTAMAEPILHFGFDDEMPGSKPRKWEVLGGGIGTNLAYISNMEWVSPRQCLVIDGSAGLLVGASEVNKITNGWAVISFCFKLQGSGADVGGLSFRVTDRATNRPPAVVGSTVYLGFKTVRLGTAQLGNWEKDRWHRVVLWFPTQGGQQQTAHGLLQRQKPDLTWETVGKRESIPASPPGTYESLQLGGNGPHSVACFDEFIALSQMTLDVPELLRK